MALQAIESISESSDASYFNVYEKTGIYKSTNPFQNLTGWGAPNIDISQVTYAQLQVKLPDPYSLLPQQNFYIYPATSLNYVDMYAASSAAFPNVINVPFQVLASTFGLTTFPTGIYEFLVTYGGSWGVTLYQWKNRIAFFSQGVCCVKTLQAKISDCGCCEGQEYEDWMRAEVALQAIIADMQCLKQNKTAEAMKILNDICNRNKCGCN